MADGNFLQPHIEHESHENIWERLEEYGRPDSDEEPMTFTDEDYMPVENTADSDAENVQQPQYDREYDSDDDMDDEPVEVEHCASYTSSDQTIWSVTPPQATRARAHNVLRSGVNGPNRLTEGKTIMETFKLIMTNEMCDVIIRETNRKANRDIDMTNECNPTAERRVWKAVTEKEFDAYLGLLLLGGVTHSGYVHTKDLWQPISHPLFRASMSVRRFWEISRFIRFDNGITREHRKQHDKAAAISDIFVMLNSNLGKYYNASANVTIDEQLYPFRGGTGFTQYIPSKPAKYGIKVWWMCDSITSYPLKGQIYTGMAASGERERNVGERVVKDLCVNMLSGSGRNVVCDNFFTTHVLAKQLMNDHKLSILGTVNKRRRFVPKHLSNPKGRRPESSMFAFSENVSMCSYVPKKNRAVVLLSTMHYDTQVVGPRQKPVMIMDYNKYKGGVDNMGKCLAEYSTKRRTNRWPLAFFYNILDVAAFATYVIYMENNDHMKVSTARRRKFLHNLSEQLTRAEIERRSTNPQITKIHSTRTAMEAVLGQTLRPVMPPSVVEERDSTGRIKLKGSCYLCPRRRQTRKACSSCNKPICLEHTIDKPRCPNCQ